ncbi:MAG: hydroxymethylbilane synthase [Planctomycetales bacterium]
MSAPTIPLRIATRSSALALWQARHVAALLAAAAPECDIQLVPVSTVGDRDQTGALRELGGLGVFTREVQVAVLDRRADLAVHSLKDLPTESAPGLCLAAVPPREETADALLLPAGGEFRGDVIGLPNQARIGTGSLRRRAQLLHARPDLQFEEARGNVETRLRKLDEGQFDALILAVAGLRRLGLDGRIAHTLAPPLMFPAVGQGALGIECRADDAPVREWLQRIDDPRARSAVTSERALLASLHAGCHAPVGAVTAIAGTELTLEGVVLSPDGQTRLTASAAGPASDAAALGAAVARLLLEQGAARLIGP